MSERDKFLTKEMGVPYGWQAHEFVFKWGVIDFSTWQGFGKLWEWAQEQEWWAKLTEQMWSDVVYDYRLVELMVGDSIHPICINPDRFANAVYEFLKEM